MRWIAWVRGPGLAMSFLAASASYSFAADTSPLVGNWHWNRAQSRLPDGESVPADLTASITRADAMHVHWTITTLAAPGDKVSRSFDVPANGEAYPISSDTTAAIRLTAPGMQAVFNGPNGEVDRLTCAVGAAGKQMTCTGQVQDKTGKTSSYVDVYDRI
jgi:hypothetical protein